MRYTTQQLKDLDKLVLRRARLNQDKAQVDDVQIEQALLWCLHNHIKKELSYNSGDQK